MKNNNTKNELDTPENHLETMCQELTAENNLYEVYLASRRIPFSTINRNLLIFFSAISLLLTLTIDSDVLAENILLISNNLISVVLTVLGFLIAGYTIFCSVMNHDLSMDLYHSETHLYGFSQLKHSHLLFMRVFFYYLIYTFILILIQFFSKSQLLINLMENNLETIECVFYLINYLVFNVLFIGIVFLLLQLASFTFNIYHSVMTSICLTEINK